MKNKALQKYQLFVLLAVAAALISILVTAGARTQTSFPLYVANEGSNTIVKFTSDGVGSQVADFTSGLSSPVGLAFDDAGNLYVANANTITVEKITPSGSASIFIGSGSLSQGLTGGLTFDSAGNLFVGVATPGSAVIKKFSPTGADLGVFASSGVGNAYDMAFDSSGNLYVPNGGLSTIRVFTPAGIGSTLADNGLLNHPAGIAFDKAGNLYAANGGDSNIVKFSGGVATVFAGSVNGVAGPNGLAFDSAGNLYVANSSNLKILRLTPGGTGTTFASGGLSFPFGLAFQPAATPFLRAAGFATNIPGGTGNFTSLPSAPGYSISGLVAFYGEGAGGQAGIYQASNGSPAKIADLNTAIPSGTGNFTAFLANGTPIAPSIDGGNVAFFGAGSSGQQGIYVSVNGSPLRAADTATAIPGGTGNFTSFLQVSPPIVPSPVISGNNVAFFGAGTGGQQGIYTYDYVVGTGPPIKIADTATPIPGGTGAFTGFASQPSLSGNNVAFIGAGASGQEGIYRATGGSSIKLADLNTAIPGGIGNFTTFLSLGLPIAPAISGTSVAFFGAGSGGQQGIYAIQSGPLLKIADTGTAIPGGTGDFTSFGDVSLSDSDVAFLGFGASGQEGIYDLTGGTLTDVVDLNDVLNGRAITALSLSRTGVFGDPIAFEATFADGSQGIYTVPEPSAALLCGFGALAFAGGRRRHGRAAGRP